MVTLVLIGGVLLVGQATTTQTGRNLVSLSPRWDLIPAEAVPAFPHAPSPLLLCLCSLPECLQLLGHFTVWPGHVSQLFGNSNVTALAKSLHLLAFSALPPFETSPPNVMAVYFVPAGCSAARSEVVLQAHRVTAYCMGCCCSLPYTVLALGVCLCLFHSLCSHLYRNFPDDRSLARALRRMGLRETRVDSCFLFLSFGPIQTRQRYFYFCL